MQQVARNKEKLIPAISLTQEVADRSLMKNNSPVIAPRGSQEGTGCLPRFLGLCQRLCAGHYPAFQDIAGRVRQDREPLLWVSYNN